LCLPDREEENPGDYGDNWPEPTPDDMAEIEAIQERARSMREAGVGLFAIAPR
jgi:hypothetical protein